MAIDKANKITNLIVTRMNLMLFLLGKKAKLGLQMKDGKCCNIQIKSLSSQSGPNTICIYDNLQ